jgi:ubiquinone biosynthesis protein COQ4
MQHSDDEQKARDAYLGKNIRKVAASSSLLQSTSAWLNNGKIREIIAVWLLRKNGPDFPVEADHTLGLAAAFGEVLPDSEVLGLFEAEMAEDAELNAWIKQGYVSTYQNEDFLRYPAGTVGGMIGHQIREHGFDLTLGVGNRPTGGLNPLQYFRLRTGQAHDFEHIITGGQFNSIGEIAVTFGRCANQSRYFSPKLASALNAYMMFAGLRMVTRSLLHYPETWVTALQCLEQGIRVGLASPPFWYFKWEDVFEMTPVEARRHFGVPEIDFVDSAAASVIFREDAPRLAEAAE